jgi:DNA-binding response OmpR family regulator
MQAAKKKILLVDDDMQIRKSLHKVLCAEGYEVVLAANGQEGIRQFYADQFDLLLLDVSLPDMSGWEVFGTITSINPFLPIIIITGKDEQHDLAVLAGVGALIEKPLDVPRLLETVNELLAESPEVHLQRLVGRRSVLRYEGRRAGGVT